MLQEIALRRSSEGSVCLPRLCCDQGMSATCHQLPVGNMCTPGSSQPQVGSSSKVIQTQIIQNINNFCHPGSISHSYWGVCIACAEYCCQCRVPRVPSQSILLSAMHHCLLLPGPTGPWLQYRIAILQELSNKEDIFLFNPTYPGARGHALACMHTALPCWAGIPGSAESTHWGWSNQSLLRDKPAKNPLQSEKMRVWAAGGYVASCSQSCHYSTESSCDHQICWWDTTAGDWAAQELQRASTPAM